jgi:hypothetical protein
MTKKQEFSLLAAVESGSDVFDGEHCTKIRGDLRFISGGKRIAAVCHIWGSETGRRSHKPLWFHPAEMKMRFRSSPIF